jgi:uncharacterized membrane protein YqjE
MVMDDPVGASDGALGSLRRLLDTGLSIGQNRLELLAVEMQEEKLRLVQIFVLVSAVVAFALMSLTMLSLTLVVLFWESSPLAVLGGLSLLYLLATAAAWRVLSKRLGGQSAPFSGNIAEMKKDKEWLDSRS